MSRLAKSFALLLSFAGLLLGATNANAVACATTGVAPNTWSAATTWAAPCNKAGGPVLGDTVTIGAAHTVTVTAPASAASITIAAPTAAHGININAGITLNGGVISMTAPTANFASTIAVGTGTLNATSIAINGGTAPTRISQVTVGATGIVNVTGVVTAGGTAAQSRFIATGTSTITIGGAFSPGAFTPGASTLTVSGNFTPVAMVANTGTVILTGGAAQSMSAFTTYNNVTINKTVGTIATLAGNTTMTGALTVTSGTLAKNTRTLGVAGNLVVNGVITGTTGNITLSGAAATVNGTGSITTTTGLLSITAAKSILATANLTIASPTTLSANVTVTNNGIINKTTTAALNGANATTSIWVNAAGSTLNYAGTNAPMAIGVLTASAANTVNYNGAAQTVKVSSGAPATYYHLTLSGSGTKTMPATAMTVTGNFTMSGAAATSATAAQALTVGGNFTLTALNTFTAGVFLHSVSGNWSNSGTFTAAAGAGTVTFTGTNSTLGGTVATTFNNLIVNKTAGNNVPIVCATPSPTVNNTLTLTSGRIVTSGTSPGCLTTCATQVPVIVAAAGTVSGGSATSYVQGALRKMFNAAATLNFRVTAGQDEFPVGDTANYSPIEITTGTTSTAGSVTACVTPTDHPQVTTPVATTGIDAAKSVNRYWSITTATINTTAAPVDATFKFVAGNVDVGATTANFIVEDWNGTAWFPTTIPVGGAGATSTRAQNIDLTRTPNDISIGEPFSGFTAVPGLYNAFETATPAGAILGKIQTKVAGTGFSVDVVHINATKTGVSAVAIPVEVRLLNSSAGGVLDVNGCNAAWPLIQALPTFNIPASGRGTIPATTAANSYRSVRFQIRSPVGGPVYTQIGCSTDLFSIRPQSLTVTAWDATWATAGTSRILANITASGGNVHKATTSATPLPFTLRATPVPATATNYDGSPATVTTPVAFPNCTGLVVSGLCTNPGVLSYTAGSWTGLGVRENATATYSEAGAFNLQFEDTTYASVDAVDGSTSAMRTVPATASVQIGRFVPDHFEVTVLITPTFKTFNATDAACSAGVAPRRTFTYIGQSFGYVTAPQATILARNAAGATTTNYAGTLWKIGGTSSSNKDCTTNPNICQFTSSWTGGGNISSVAESYAYTLTPASTPGWDSASATTAAAIVTPGTGAGIGTGTIAIYTSNTLAFLRSTTVPQAKFTANITDTISVADASENAVANNGIISTTTPLVFNGGGSGIAFDSGNAFYYGRLKLSNAYGSELLYLPIPIQTQYWDATTSAFVTNSADNCTTIQSANIALVKTPIGCTTAVSGNVSFNSGLGNLKLSKPGAKCTADITVNLAAELPSKAYLQGKWSGVNYDQNPTARATFGVYKGRNEFIYLRENY